MIYEFKNPRAEMYKLHPSVFSVVKHTVMYILIYTVLQSENQHASKTEIA